MDAERRLAELGFSIEPLADSYALDTSGAKFVSHLAVGELLYLSGTVPEKDGLPHLTGALGADLTIVQLTGWVNSAPEFSDQPRVINGATDLLVEVFGRRGLGTRAAIGCRGLAYDSSVEIVLVVRFDGGPVSEPMETAGAAQD
jgi:hypothetical protein